ncbi:hypothetical protein [Brevundimonas sp. GCM10030266]|uniref:hypothetical protein n=1 Tax=Brevundimonas sp. GCM10030266 TaxID=3273386 RepID=UPI00361E3C79
MISLAIATLLTISGPDNLSGSSDATIERDFRCYAVSMAALTAGEVEETEIRYVTGMAVYYLGGLDARQTGTDWIAKGQQMTWSEASALLPEIESDCWRRYSDQLHRLADLLGDTARP